VAGASLEWLIDPISTETFFREFWEQKPLVINRRRPDYFRSLLSLDEVDRVLTTLDLRHPNITLKDAARSITSADYTIDGETLDIARVYQHFQDGSTITLAYLDDIVPSLAACCRALEREFSFPFQANVYLTPAGAKGAKYHYDTHDVFVLQAAHSKRWTLYGTPVVLPLTGQGFDASQHQQGPATLEFELQAGDIAYIPRGVVHDAQSGDEISLHITVGALSYRWMDLLLELVADAGLNDASFRRSLPAGFARPEFNRAQARSKARELLQKLAAHPNIDAILDRFVDQFLSACPPMLRGQLSQLERLERLTLDSVACARSGVIYQIRADADADAVMVDCYGRTIRLPLHASDALRVALSGSSFVVRQLADNLDAPGKLTLVRRLVREGLVEVLE